MRRVLLIVAAVCLIAACAPRTASGLYVHQGETEVVALQIVSTQDGTLSGSLQAATANDRHQVSVQSVTLTGAMDGNALTLSTPAPWFGNSTTFSGVRSGDEITLTFATGRGVNNVVFRRSTQAEFARLTEELRLHQQQEAQAVARQQALVRERAAYDAMRASIPDFSASLERATADYAQRLPRFDAAVNALETLTQRARETANARDLERDGVRQGQLSVHLSQISIETNQIGIELEQSYGQFVRDREAAQRRAVEINQWCDRTQDAVCTRFRSALGGYNAAASARAAAFARAGAALTSAQAEQERLL